MATAQRTWGKDTRRSRLRAVYHPPRAPRVLIVAKNPRFRWWARRQLRTAGFEILRADDGLRASTVVDQEPPDLIVVDTGVPWFGVMGLLGRLLRDTATVSIPTLFVAARATRSLTGACRAVGIAVLVRRPGAPNAVLHVPAPAARTTALRVGTRASHLLYERSPDDGPGRRPRPSAAARRSRC